MKKTEAGLPPAGKWQQPISLGHYLRASDNAGEHCKMSRMKLGYARVSRPDQTTEQQEAALRKAGCDQIFVETASGAKRDRPKLAELMKIAREGDTIVVWKLDRLARSLKHLIDLASTMKTRGVELQSLTDNIDTSTASGRLLFNMLSSIAEFERDIITERVGAGLARARAAAG